MIEKEQNYIDLLRSQIASSPDEKKLLELGKTEKNLQKLQAMLLSQNEVSEFLLLLYLFIFAFLLHFLSFLFVFLFFLIFFYT